MSLSARSSAIAGLAAFGALVAACPAYADTSQTLQVSCDFPLVGPALFDATFATTVPAVAGTTTPGLQITLTANSASGEDGTDAAFTALKLVKAAKFNGTVTADLEIASQASPPFSLSLQPELTITSSTLGSEAPSGFVAKGSTLPLKLPGGPASLLYTGFALNLAATKADGTPITGLSAAQNYPDSDGDPNTFDAPCTPTSPVVPPPVIVVPTPTPMGTGTPIPTPRPQPTGSPIPTPIPSPTPSPTPTPKPQPTGLPTPTPSPTPRVTPLPTGLPFSPTPTPTPRITPTPTPMRTPFGTPTPKPTPTPAPIVSTKTIPMICTYPLVGDAATDVTATIASDHSISFTVSTAKSSDGTDVAYAGYRLTHTGLVSASVDADLSVASADTRNDVKAVGTYGTSTVGATPPVVLPDSSRYPLGFTIHDGANGIDPSTEVRVSSLHLNVYPYTADSQSITAWNAGIAPEDDSDGRTDTFDVHCRVPAGGDDELYSPPSTATATPTPTPTPPPVTPKPIPYGYALAGQATLKTLTKGTLPLTGKADAKLTLATGDFTAALSLNQTQGNLVALGFLPVAATVQIVPQGDATGTLKDSGLTVNTKVRIKLPKVTLFGLQLGGGSGCQAKNISAITLKSPGEFSPLDGGTISGTFTISDLVNCGALNGVISPLTAGSGNAIALKLTPAAVTS